VDYLQDFPLTNWAWKKHRLLEQLVFKQASKITIASPTWKSELEKIGARNVDVVYYGYDEADFKNIKRKRTDNNFEIFHGGLLGYDRFPKTLFDVLMKMCEEDATFSIRLKIKLAGKIDYRITEYLQHIDLIGKVEILGFIPREQVLQYELNSDLLLLPLNKSINSKGRLPGKLYEYLRTGHTILALGPEDSDAAQIINKAQQGSCISYENHDKLYSSLKIMAYNEVESDQNLANIQKYSNFHQTKIVANYLDQISSNEK
jgi:hypothetical protein